MIEYNEDRHAAWLLHRVIERKGKDHQIDIAIEEMSELTKALLKDRRHHNPETVNNIAEEMADVQICLEELRIIYENENLVNSMMEMKLKRLARRLDDREDELKKIKEVDE